MLFTLVAFLSPTILVYYGLFAAVSIVYVIGGSSLNRFKARLIIIIIHATSETLLAFMNHFPLFVLMLRIKDPRRLPGEWCSGLQNLTKKSPGGIVFVPTQGDKDINGATLTLKVCARLYVLDLTN
jgi:hypothetical protein